MRISVFSNEYLVLHLCELQTFWHTAAFIYWGRECVYEDVLSPQLHICLYAQSIIPLLLVYLFLFDLDFTLMGWPKSYRWFAFVFICVVSVCKQRICIPWLIIVLLYSLFVSLLLSNVSCFLFFLICHLPGFLFLLEHWEVTSKVDRTVLKWSVNPWLICP